MHLAIQAEWIVRFRQLALHQAHKMPRGLGGRLNSESIVAREKIQALNFARRADQRFAVWANGILSCMARS